MNLENIVDGTTDLENFLNGFRETANISGINFTQSHKVILSCIFNNPGLISKKKQFCGPTAHEIQIKWLNAYKNAYENRTSVRTSGQMNTVADPGIDQIIQLRLSNLTPSKIEEIKFAHRLSMSAENIIGLILEEYLSIELAEFNWHCCWGEVTKFVDFCNENGQLLQVKNRSNSENSASSSVRINTEIKFWYRVKAQNGNYNWDKLNEINQTNKFSEEKFISFLQNLIRENSDVLNVEPDNPWQTDE